MFFKFYLQLNIPGLCYEYEYHECECVSKKLGTSPNLPGDCRNAPRTTGYFCRSRMKFRTPRIWWQTQNYGHPVPNRRFCWLLQIINTLINDVFWVGYLAKWNFWLVTYHLFKQVWDSAVSGSFMESFRNILRNMLDKLFAWIGRVFTAGLILHMFNQLGRCRYAYHLGLLGHWSDIRTQSLP